MTVHAYSALDTSTNPPKIRQYRVQDDPTAGSRQKSVIQQLKERKDHQKMGPSDGYRQVYSASTEYY